MRKTAYSELIDSQWQVIAEILNNQRKRKTCTELAEVWQVERSFGWLNFRRRLAKDYEKLAASHEVFLEIAFISFIITNL